MTIAAATLVDRLNKYARTTGNNAHYDVVVFDKYYAFYEYTGHDARMITNSTNYDVDIAAHNCIHNFCEEHGCDTLVDLCARVFGTHVDNAADFIKSLNEEMRCVTKKTHMLKFRAFGDSWDGTAASHYQLTDVDQKMNIIALGRASTDVEIALRRGLTEFVDNCNLQRVEVEHAIANAFIETDAY